MRKVLLSLVLALTLSISGSVFAQKAYNFGDYRSVTLSTKAWDALNKGDIEGVLAYASKCLELYEGEAKKMQDRNPSIHLTIRRHVVLLKMNPT